MPSSRRELFLGACDEYIPQEPDKIVTGDFRPRIRLPGDGRLLDDFAADLVKELRTKSIFNHGGLVMVIDERTNKLRPIGQSAFRSWLENPAYGNVVCEGRVGRGHDAFLQDQTLSEEGAKGVLASHRFVRGIREITRVNTVRLPIKREDGTIELLPEGYDEPSRIFTIATCDYELELPLDAAKAQLEMLLKDTAFKKCDRDRSLAVTLAMMLAPFCDSLFGRFACRPSFIVQANQEGAGKTTLIRIALAPIFGPVKLTPPPAHKAEDKLVELLNSVVQSGAPYLVFDNWVGKVDSGALAAFITANALSARVLGTSYMFDAERNCLVFISAIRANVAGEMRRRSLFIDLFVEEAKAEDRKIDRPIDEGDILAVRGDILASLWALVRHWRDSGRTPGTQRHASFDEWGKIIGGILESAGYVSPLLPPLLALDERLQSITQVVRAAMDRMLTDQLIMEPPDLLQMAREAGAFSWILDEEPPTADKEKRSERRLFFFNCDQFKGRTFTFDEVKINFDSIGEGHSKRWRFIRVRAQAL